MKDEQSRRLVHLWSAMITEANLLERLSLPSLWDVSYIATAKHMRGLGLGRFLLSHQRRVARKLGYGAISVGSSHFYLSKVGQSRFFIYLKTLKWPFLCLLCTAHTVV